MEGDLNQILILFKEKTNSERKGKKNNGIEGKRGNVTSIESEEFVWTGSGELDYSSHPE